MAIHKWSIRNIEMSKWMRPRRPNRTNKKKTSLNKTDLQALWYLVWSHRAQTSSGKTLHQDGTKVEERKSCCSLEEPWDARGLWFNTQHLQLKGTGLDPGKLLSVWVDHNYSNRPMMDYWILDLNLHRQWILIQFYPDTCKCALRKKEDAPNVGGRTCIGHLSNSAKTASAGCRQGQNGHSIGKLLPYEKAMKECQLTPRWP